MPEKSPLVVLGAYMCSLREAQWLIDHLSANGYEIVEKKPVNPIADNALNALGHDHANPFDGNSLADTRTFGDLMKAGRS